jgi:hypothetical protein
MRKLLTRWLNRRVVIKPVSFRDRRTQAEIDRDIERIWESRVARNEASRGMYRVIGVDSDFVPPYLEVQAS